MMNDLCLDNNMSCLALLPQLAYLSSSPPHVPLQALRLSASQGAPHFDRYRDLPINDLSNFAQGHLGELQKILLESLSAPDALEHVSRKDLLQKAKRKDVIIIDVRPSDEYETAHLPFALSIPVHELSKHLRLLPKNKEIVAYCRGPYCFLAQEAVEILRRKGFKASRMKDSVHDWEAHGLQLEGNFTST